MDYVIADDSVDEADADVAPDSGTPQYFTSGDPLTGKPATIWPGYQANAIMKEIMTVIAGGGQTPDRTNNAQMLAAIKQIVQQETGNYAVDTGAANAYVIAPNPPIPAYTDGLPLRFLATNANTGDSTINVSSLGTKQIVRDDGSILQPGDIPAGGIANILYSASLGKFFLISTVQSSLAAIQAQATNYAADSGADGTHYACTLSPALVSHTVGMPVRIKAAHTNTGAASFNPGPGAIGIRDRFGNALAAGEIVAGQIVEFFYDGTFYEYAGAIAVEVQDQGGNWSTDTGADGTHYACTLVPALAAHNKGMPIRIVAAHTNTGSATFNPGVSGVLIQDRYGQPLVGGEIVAGQMIEFIYDGTAYQFQTISFRDIQYQTPCLATTVGGSANAINVAVAPPLTSHIAGLPIRFVAAHTNTGPTTFIQGAGATRNVVDPYGSPLEGGEIIAGQLCEVIFDGATYQLTTPIPRASTADVENANAVGKYVDPASLVLSPFTCKAFVNFSVSGGSITVHNILNCTLTRAGTGAFNVALANTPLQMRGPFVIGTRSGVPVVGCAQTANPADGATVEIDFYTLATTQVDPDFACIMFF